MRARARWMALGGAFPAIALLSDGCRTATQVTVEIGTNVLCSDMHGVEIVVARSALDAERRAALDVPGTRYPTASTVACTEGPAPRTVGTLVITPGESEAAIVVVTAFGGAHLDDCLAPTFPPGCIVARRRFSFVDHTALTLPIVLDPECSGIPCNASSTCVGKKCVDSKVECASGTCGPPGEPGPDGGALEVDGASPLDATPADSSPADGSPSDAARDGDADSGTDAGRAPSCPVSASCAGAIATSCASAVGTVGCCYETNPASCKPLGQCAAISGCCRSSDDCTGTDVCCASTPTASASTVITCKSRVDCSASLGAVVCSTPGNSGCGAGHVCIGSIYSTAPDYYGCS